MRKQYISFFTFVLCCCALLSNAQITSNTPCSGNALLLQYTGVVTGTTTYAWAGPGSFSSTVQNPVIDPATPANAGIYTLTVSGSPTGVFTVNATVTLNPLPSAILGSFNVCSGFSTTLADPTTPGNWTATPSSIATIGSSTGVLAGVSAGNVNITYTLPLTGCYITRTDTIVTLPNPGTITGVTPMCQGDSARFTETVATGTWNSANPLIATVTSAGEVTAVGGGVTNIYYQVFNACGSTNATVSLSVTATPNPGTVTGSFSVCVGSSTPLSDATATGVGAWSSGTPAVATVGAVSGLVTGVSTGTVVISHIATNSCGSTTATATVTVGAPPATPLPISGGVSACAGSTLSLGDATAGGAWFSTSAGVATISAGGVVNALVAGTTTISYTMSSACGSIATTELFTVNPLPNAGAITGVAPVCTGNTLTLADPTGVGVGSWSSSNPAQATVSGAGVVTGVAAGSPTISYVVTNSCGTATTTAAITVNTAPSAGTITSGSGSFVCVGLGLSLSDATGGGSWSSANPGIATVNSSGVVTGVSVGITVISYTIGSSCGAVSATFSITVGGLPNPGIISGAPLVCLGLSTTSLSETVAGGVWSSGTPSLATVSALGIVTGGADTGYVNIYYTVTNTCGTDNATISVHVSEIPIVSPIVGLTNICAGIGSTLTDATTGGTWSSSSTSVATVSATGIVTGITNGATTISYAVSNSCGSATVTHIDTVRSAPYAGFITGPLTTCIGSSITLVDTVSGGVWSSGSTPVATVSPTGVVTGIALGSVNIYYSITNSCGTTNATVAISVVSPTSMTPILGAYDVCVGGNTTLHDATAGGTWSSSNTAIATVNSSGIVSGVALGTATISYGAVGACGTTAYATASFSVITAPYEGVIIGMTSMCAGTSTTFTETVAGGTWSSGTPSVATISATGVVNAVSGGTDIITYQVTNACGISIATGDLTILPLPFTGAITGTTTECVGSTTTLIDTAGSGFGTWSSSNTTVATVSATGVVTGIAPGSATISYGLSNSCGTGYATTPVTILIAPSTAGIITGSPITCPGSTTTLADSIAGGVWTSSNTTIATIDATGVLSGILVGTTTVTYRVSNICGTMFTTTLATVSPTTYAGVITSSLTTTCAGDSILLSDVTTGGVWSSGTPSVATVSAAGYVTGVSAGVVTISYTKTTVCGAASATTIVNVNPQPIIAPVTGVSRMCAGVTASLSDVTYGFTNFWSSKSTGIATVSPAGVVTGISGGIDTIVYHVTNVYGCTGTVIFADTIVAIPNPGVLTGVTTDVCQGLTITLYDTTASISGGVWSTGDATIAPDSAIGTRVIITGASLGTTNITYSVTNGLCAAAVSTGVTVNPDPTVGPISGAGVICRGSTATLSDVDTGGVWSSSNATATVVGITSTTGLVTGVSVGIDTISYTITNVYGCTATAKLIDSVNASGGAGRITGPTTDVCATFTIALADTTSGGVWSSSNPLIATVSTTGEVTGLASGTINITYSVTYGSCAAEVNTAVTVFPIPSVSAITGATSLCPGNSISLADGTTGGIWHTGDSAIATVNDTSGLVMGVTSGTVSISYIVTNIFGCHNYAIATDTVTAPPVVPAITGALAICAGATTPLADSITGGTWLSINSAVARISATGIVTAVATGIDTIAYSIRTSAGCAGVTYFAIGVDTLPNSKILPVGGASLCHGNPVDLSVTGTDSSMGYQWYYNGAAIAGATSSTYVADTAGYYTLGVTFGSCGTLLATGTTVVAQPNPVIRLDTGIVLITDSFSTYQWLHNDTLITGANRISIADSSTGNYQVIVTNSYGCVDTSAIYSIFPLNVPGIQKGAFSVKLFPNPATSVINIEAPEQVNVTVTTIDGKVVIRENAINSIDVSGLANGMYIISVYDKNNALIQMSKIMKME